MENRPRSTRSAPPRRAALSTQQIAILAVIVVLNLGLLALAAVFFLAPRGGPAPAAPAQIASEAPVEAQPLPPTWTPVTGAPATNPAGPLAGLPAGCAERSGEIRQGTITRVIDRQTLEVTEDSGVFTVTYAGIAFPQQGAGLDDLTVQSVRALAEGKPVILAADSSGQDGQGRLVRYVFAGGIFLNAEMVRLGFAQADPGAPDQACLADFQRAEQQARGARLGMWKATPIPTRTFVPFVTVNPQAACDCSIRYECSDFQTHDAAQACYNACNDYNSRLDEDRDGIACEDLP